MTELAPIALFVYNRPELLLRVLNSLKQNPEVEKSKLYIFSDGSKNKDDINKVNAVRKIIANISWSKELEIIKSEKNQGLAKSIISGVTALLKKHDSVIVLEDDLLVSKGFLKYMNEALRIYKNSNDVICVSGYIFALDKKLPETFFINGADCLGWATWKRGWDLLETDPKKILNLLMTGNLSDKFDYKGKYPYTNMLQDQLSGKKYSWAILWHATAFIKNKLTLYPGLSLVSHIGINGTNYSSDPFLDKNNVTDEIKINPIPVKESEIARDAIVEFFAERKKYFNKKNVSVLQKIKSHFK